AAALEPAEASARARALVDEDADLRQRIVTIGLPILLPDGKHALRGAEVKVRPDEELSVTDPRLVDRGWVDLREENWARWRARCQRLLEELTRRPRVEEGSTGDHEYGDPTGALRPGRLASWIFRVEDRGERIKR
ncbi:MAG TPA: hypothetical protein VK849_05080, partial [Longimicrobiales bacterium]|nr:hypothetical protein [Longimicrobiales bacterium]